MSEHEVPPSTAPSVSPLPPPCPPAPPPAPRRRRQHEIVADGFQPLGRITPLTTAEALLKQPGKVVYEVVKGAPSQVAAALMTIIGACALGYGWVIGSFSGGEQAWAAPLKLLAIIPFSALICLPSLYIFTCLGGANQSLGQTAGLLLGMLALAGILMIGFAPIAWIFSQSTHAVAFMGFLHVAFWIVSGFLGLRLLNAAFRCLNGRRIGFLPLWGLILMVVTFQVAALVRPLVGPFDGFRLQGKKAFIVHWAESMK
jgi:hypothetical protein